MVDAVKFCHVSDSHLGYFQYNKEERLRDFGKAMLDAFEKVQQEKPDFIIYTGDLFHEFNPKPVALHQFVKAFNKHIRPLNVPLVMTSGNHDASAVQSLRAGGTIYDFLVSVIPNLLFISNGLADICRVDGTPLAIAVGLGYQKKRAPATLKQIVEQRGDELKKYGDSVPTILMLHEYVNGMPLKVHDIEEDEITRPWRFNYIGVGHCHKPYSNKRLRIYCPGATEHTSASDWDVKPEFYSVTMRRDEGWEPHVQAILLENIRPKQRVAVSFDNAAPEAVLIKLKETMRANNHDGALIQYTVSGKVAGFVPLGKEQFVAENDKNLDFDIVNNLEITDAGPSRAEFNPDTVRKDFLREQWRIAEETKLQEFDTTLESLKTIAVTAGPSEYEDKLLPVLLDIARDRAAGKVPPFRSELGIMSPLPQEVVPVPSESTTPKSAKKPKAVATPKKGTRQSSLLRPKEGTL